MKLIDHKCEVSMICSIVSLLFNDYCSYEYKNIRNLLYTYPSHPHYASSNPAYLSPASHSTLTHLLATYILPTHLLHAHTLLT
jgi:hypothetical protein